MSNNDQPSIMTSAKFSAMIESISRDSSAMEAVIDYCEKNHFEIESAAKLCNAALKKRMAEEANTLNMLKPVPEDDNE